MFLALHCWAWPAVIFWSLVPEHAVRHAFPAFPAWAGLAALVWLAWIEGRLRWHVPRLAPRSAFACLVLVWLVAKVIFVHEVVPARNAGRDPRAKGEAIAALVPPSATLFLCRLKDEGIMFYFGRHVHRVESPEQLPVSSQPLYCIWDQAEWRALEASPGNELILGLQDEQGAPIYLSRRAGNSITRQASILGN